MWDSNFLFYLIVTSLILFILICFVVLLIAIVSLGVVGKIHSSSERLTSKGEETMEVIQEVAYDAPGWSIAIFNSILGMISKPKRTKRKWWEKFLSE